MRARLYVAALAVLILSGSVALAQLLLTGAGQPVNGGGSTCDPNFSSVVLLLGNDNAANGTTTFADQSNSAHTLTSSGAAYSNLTAPAGMSTSINVPGSNSYVKSANSTDWQLGSGNFTIEFWIKIPNQTGLFLLNTLVSGVDELMMEPNGSNFIQYAATNTSTWDIENGSTPYGSSAYQNTWTHIAFYRVGTQFYNSMGGSVTNTGTSSGTMLATANPLAMGDQAGSGSAFNGNFASLRITKGVARYGSSNFTPPSLPLPHC